jgi:hypothetical protein
VFKKKFIPLPLFLERNSLPFAVLISGNKNRKFEFAERKHEFEGCKSEFAEHKIEFAKRKHEFEGLERTAKRKKNRLIIKRKRNLMLKTKPYLPAREAELVTLGRQFFEADNALRRSMEYPCGRGERAAKSVRPLSITP